MNDTERHARGQAIRRAVLGDAHVDRATATATPFTAGLQDLVTRHAWGEIWTRPGLDHRTRSAVTVAMLVALGRLDELKLHVGGALRNGLTAAEIEEVLLQAAVYCGIPAGVAAFHAAAPVIAEAGPAPAPAARHAAAGAGVVLQVLSDQVTLLGELGDLVAAEVVVPPGGGTPLHRHASRELFRVEAGAVVFELGPGGRRAAGPGDVVTVPPGVAHGYRHTGEGPARLLVLFDRSLERFFRAAHALGPRAAVPAVLDLARRHGVEILEGPPPAA